MVAGGEHCQLRAAIEVLVPYTSDGHVRLLAPLTHELAETMPLWAKSLGPIAEHVAHVFGKAMDGTYSAATPLTSRRHRDAQAVVKARKVEATRRALQAGSSSAQQLSPPLLRCGPVLIAEELSRTLAMSAARRASPPTPPRRPRSAVGVAPLSPPVSGRSRSGTRPIPSVYDPELFRREIRPRLALVKLSEIAEATGCSRRTRRTSGVGSGPRTFRPGRHS